MNQQLTFILSMSCCLPLLAYIILYQRVDKLYYPLIFIFVLGFLAEITSWLNRQYFHIPGYTYYTYSIATVIWLWLYFSFYKNVGLTKNKALYTWIIVAYLGFVIVNWALLYKKENFFNFFRTSIVYAIIILLFSVELFSRQIFSNVKNVLMNPLFLIGLAGIIFHAFFIYINALNLLKTDDGDFVNRVYNLQRFSNVFCYIVYTIAIICIPKTRTYIKSY